MKKGLAIEFLCLFALVLVSVITCPDKEAHETAVMEEINTALDSSIKDNLKLGDSELEQGVALFGSSLASSLVGNVLESNLKVKNYFVVSVGEFSLLGKTNTVSVGFLGHVFVNFSSDDILKQLNESND